MQHHHDLISNFSILEAFRSKTRRTAVIVSALVPLAIATSFTHAAGVYRPRVPSGNQKYILTPPAGPMPRINGARVFGVRPDRPFLFTIPATGSRPMRFSAIGLPAGLKLNSITGRITGKLGRSALGAHSVILHATNSLGSASEKFRIVVGNTIALTPPMGWNSWNCWAGAVNQQRVLAAAKAMVATGLINYGWTYICIDDTWQGKRAGPLNAIQPDMKRFPDMKALCSEIHHMGLKAGIYSTPWTTSYGNHIGESSTNKRGLWHRPTVSKHGIINKDILPWGMGKYQFESRDARQWAAWGFDYLKYDWNPIRFPQVKQMYDALLHCRRDIVFSLSNNAPYPGAAKWIPYANLWRITGDSRDNWPNLRSHWQAGAKWAHLQSPGHWNDPDMMTLGWVGWGRRQHYSHLTPNEQYLEVSSFSLMGAPLILGNNLNRMGPFTLNLLSNAEVLAVDQDPLGIAGVPVLRRGNQQVWVKPLSDGSKAVGLFNLGTQATVVTATWSELKINGVQIVRDLWRQSNIGTADGSFSAEVPPHGVVLVKISPGTKR